MTDPFRHPSTRLVAGAVLLWTGLLLAGCTRRAAPAEEAEKTPPAPVKWEPARLVFLEEWIELLGVTQPLPDHVARITTPVEGRVQSVLRDAQGKPLVEGQHVEAGTVIAQLDDRLIRNARDRAVANQKAQMQELEQARVAREVAALDVERLRQLEPNGRRAGDLLVSPVDVKKARLTLEDAESKVRATQAKVDAAAQEVAALEQQLKLYTLAAPRKGRLGRIQVVPGQTLSVGALVAEIVDLEDEVDVLCYVPPGTARRLHRDPVQAARLGGLDRPAPADADPEGRVIFVADQAEPETGGFAVKVRFPNQAARLRANVALSIRVLIQPGKECLAIPQDALLEDQEPPGVLVVEDVQAVKVNGAEGEPQKEEQHGKVRLLQAVTGIRDRVLGQVEILRLIDKGNKWKGSVQDAIFVVKRGQGLQTGDAVKLQEEDED